MDINEEQICWAGSIEMWLKTKKKEKFAKRVTED